MNFERQFIGKVLRGEKTQFRRPHRPGRLGDDGMWAGGEKSPQRLAGQSYELTSTERRTVRDEWTGEESERLVVHRHGVIRITDVRREGLHELSEEDARREGFDSREDFYAWWRDRYNSGPLTREPVWVVEFQLDRDPVRLLSRTGDYTRSEAVALTDGHGAPEPEAVPLDVQAKITKEAREAFEAVRVLKEAERASLPASERAAEAIRRAEARGVDVTRWAQWLERKLERQERMAA